MYSRLDRDTAVFGARTVAGYPPETLAREDSTLRREIANMPPT